MDIFNMFFGGGNGQNPNPSNSSTQNTRSQTFVNNNFNVNGNSQQHQQQQRNNQQQQQQGPRQQQQQGRRDPFENFMDNFADFPNIFGQQVFNPMSAFRSHNNNSNQRPNQQNQQSYQSQSQQNNGNYQQYQQQGPQGQFQGYQQQQQQPSFRNTRSNFHNQNDSKKREEHDKKKEQKKQQLHEGMADYWKEKGNECYKKGYYDTAIEMYSKAIEKDESQSVYYCNRGKCQRMKGNYEAALKDAQEAIELDEKNIKGHLLCGQCLAQLSKKLEPHQCQDKIELAVKKMTKALTLCSQYPDKEKAKVYERELSIYILRAKKLQWYKNYELMKQKKMVILKNYSDYLESTEKDQQEKERKYTEFISLIGDPTKKLNMVIPDHLICNITQEMIEEPVTDSAGHTYEKACIEEHIKKNGLTDPLTREPISDKLYKNINVKKGVDEFLASNPWAFEFSEFQESDDIQF